MKKLVHMRKHLARHKHLIITTGVLMFVSGCAGAVTQTGNQLGKDIAAPITVPIEQGQKAQGTLKDVNERQLQENQQMEDIK